VGIGWNDLTAGKGEDSLALRKGAMENEIDDRDVAR
jgi:hypothetical protein